MLASSTSNAAVCRTVTLQKINSFEGNFQGFCSHVQSSYLVKLLPRTLSRIWSFIFTIDNGFDTSTTKSSILGVAGLLNALLLTKAARITRHSMPMLYY